MLVCANAPLAVNLICFLVFFNKIHLEGLPRRGRRVHEEKAKSLQVRGIDNAVCPSFYSSGRHHFCGTHYFWLLANQTLMALYPLPSI